jgi:hypothetical protein
MRIQAIGPMALVVMFLTMAPHAAGGWPHQLGRFTGHGWSDGYHAARRRPHAATLHPSPSTSLPWWAHPADPDPSEESVSEPLPPGLPPGNSLFRQPGDGTSVSRGDPRVGKL